MQESRNANLVRMLEKAQEKQPNNLTTKLTETMSSSLTKIVDMSFQNYQRVR